MDPDDVFNYKPLKRQKKNFSAIVDIIPTERRISPDFKNASSVFQGEETPTVKVEATPETPNLSSTEKNDSLPYCPICQISSDIFCLNVRNIKKWSDHLSTCFDKFPKTTLKECPRGISCAVKSVDHYRKFQHCSLASLRANVLMFNYTSLSASENDEKKYSATEQFSNERNHEENNRTSEGTPVKSDGTSIAPVKSDGTSIAPVKSDGTSIAPVKSDGTSLTSSDSRLPLQHFYCGGKKIDIETFKIFSSDPSPKNLAKSPAKSTPKKKRTTELSDQFKTPKKGVTRSPAKSTPRKKGATKLSDPFKTPQKGVIKSPAKSTPKEKNLSSRSLLGKNLSQQTLMYDPNKKAVVLTPQKSHTRSPMYKNLSQRTFMYDSTKKSLVLTPQKSQQKSSTHTPEKPDCSSKWESLSIRKTNSPDNDSRLLSALTKEDSLSCNSMESSPNLQRKNLPCRFALNSDDSDAGLSDLVPSESPQLSDSSQRNFLSKLKSDKSYVTVLFVSSDSEDECDVQKETSHTQSSRKSSDSSSSDNLSATQPADNLDFFSPRSNEMSVSVNAKDFSAKAKSSSTCESASNSGLTKSEDYFSDNEWSVPSTTRADHLSTTAAELTDNNHLFSKSSQLLPVTSKPPLCTPSKKESKNVTSLSTNQMHLAPIFTRKTSDNQSIVATNVELNEMFETKSKPIILSKPTAEKKTPFSIEENPRRPVMELEQFKNMFAKKSSPKNRLTTCESRQLPPFMPETKSVKPDSNNQKFPLCPFYKKIPDTAITVDAFKYGVIPGCRAYFLSHFHYDHYQGITKYFHQPLYCSQVTANLLKVNIGISSECIRPLPLYCPVMIEGVNVTLLDANHCPGAVLMLFKTKNNNVILHTGDFRADSIMEEYAAFKHIKINQLFLDTTYCNSSYAFPSQKAILDLSVSLSVLAVQENPNTLIVVGTYTIGKEKVFLEIAEAIRSKIGVTKIKKKILDCQENSYLNRLVSLNLNECQVHVVKMNSLSYKALSEHLVRYKKKFDRIVAFKPTGWTHSDQNDSLSDIKPLFERDNIILYGLPYSEHSSFSELKRFVQFVRPDKIIPTVNNGTPSSRKAMEDIFKSWLSRKPPVMDNFLVI